MYMNNFVMYDLILNSFSDIFQLWVSCKVTCTFLKFEILIILHHNYYYHYPKYDILAHVIFLLHKENQNKYANCDKKIIENKIFYL